jgi:DNA topoisomerase VI subunit B
MAESAVSEELWNEFHRVVNMTSRELDEWLRTRSAAEDAEALPDQSGTETGRHVVHILGKRRTDLTDDDARVMHNVVQRVLSERREDLEPTAGEAHWRHRLMSLGHDPLKPG